MFQSEPSVGSRRGRSSEERATRRAADFTLNSYSDLFKRSIDPLQQQQQQQVGSMCLTSMKVNAGVSFFTAWWLNRRFIYSCLMRRCWGSSLCLFVDSLCFQLVVTRCRCACITWAEPRSLMCTPTMLSNDNAAAAAAAGTHCRQTERPRASFHLLIL